MPVTVPLRIRVRSALLQWVLGAAAGTVVGAEIKDQYHRAAWEPKDMSPSSFSTGDVVFISNRWYELSTASAMCLSLLTKAFLKAVFDQVGVVVVRNGTPFVVSVDPAGTIIDEPLEQYLTDRQPRGLAVGKLKVEPGFPAPTNDVAELFVAQVKQLKPSPWYVFSASWRSAAERQYYEYITEFNNAKAAYRTSIAAHRTTFSTPGNARPALDEATRRKSVQALKVTEQRLQEMEVMREHLASRVEISPGDFRLTSGSLVSSFFATFDLLDRELPVVSRYVPQDFAQPLPFKGAKLENPVVVWKS